MKIFVMFLLLIFAGCGQFKTYIRVKPQLVYENGLLISNSQTNPYGVNIENSILKINYNLIAKNISDKPVEIDLSNSTYQANDEKKKLDCRVHHSNLRIHFLKTNEQVAVACDIEITPNSVNKLSLKDTDILFEVSLNRRVQSFTYRVFAEEFAQ
jgi:hypothetical protein